MKTAVERKKHCYFRVYDVYENVKFENKLLLLLLLVVVVMAVVLSLSTESLKDMEVKIKGCPKDYYCHY